MMSVIKDYAIASADYSDSIEDMAAMKRIWVEASKELVGKRFSVADALASLGDDAPPSDDVVDAYGLRRLLDMYPHVAELCREVVE